MNCLDFHAQHALRRLCGKVLLCATVWGLGGVPALALAHDSGSSGSSSSTSGGGGGGKSDSKSGSSAGGSSTGSPAGTGRGSSAGGSEKSESGNASGGGGGTGGNAGSGTSSTSSTPGSTVRLRESDHDQARQAVESGQIQPLRALMSRLEKEYPGEVMGVELERHDGSWIYEIKLLQPGGWLTKLKVDARTGVVVKQVARRGSGNRDRDD